MRKNVAKNLIAALALSTIASPAVLLADTAATTQSETTLESLRPGVSPSDKDSIDNEITNARMRADAGSQSRNSMSLSLGYKGGSVKSPFDAQRPNLSGDPSTETSAAMSGSISARHRFNPRTSATLGAGISALEPFHGVEEFSIDNPALGLNRTYRVGPFQTMTSVSATLGTSESWKNANQTHSFAISQTMMSQIGNSGFTAGASVQVVTNHFSDSATGPGDARTDWRIGFYPQLEYTINDRLSARTVFGYFNYYSFRGTDRTDFKNVVVYQSVGIGISITRDIYLYPNVQFIPDDLSVDNTNVAMSATINLF